MKILVLTVKSDPRVSKGAAQVKSLVSNISCGLQLVSTVAEGVEGAMHIHTIFGAKAMPVSSKHEGAARMCASA